MAYAVLVAWIVQAAVGVVLFIGWLRHAHGRAAAIVITHVVLSLAGLGFWIWFVASGALAPAWIAFVLLNPGNALGDIMLLRRARRLVPEAKGLFRGYGAALAAIFRGRIPLRVGFHAVFAGVVYFSCLGVCIGASVAMAQAAT